MQEGDHLLIKDQAMKELNLSFMDDYFRSLSGILKRIDDSINSMKCNFDDDYILPPGRKRILSRKDWICLNHIT